ncbi:MAG TPA: hypothetical protein VNZ58_02740 [Thermomicrobiales bacterium]|nr:hypothetical protein [Thermomicrobiales bacterium]
METFASMQVGDWLTVLGAVILLNAIPAFMPPTWALLAYFYVQRQLPLVPLALVGAAGAMIGRFLLASVSRKLGVHVFPRRWQENITTLSATIQSHRAMSFSTLGLFVLGPIPTNHLFIAAGVAGTPLLPVVLAFGVARFVSYLIWVSAVSTAASTLGDALRLGWGQGVALVAQILGFILLIVVMQIDWWRVFQRWRRNSPPDSST